MNTAERLFAKLSFSGQKKTRIIRQIQRLTRADVPIAKTLDMLWDLYSKRGKKPKEPIAQMVHEWRTRLSEGQSLASSMHGWISLPEELIIQAGEQSDRLASALDDALQADGAARGIRKAILGGLAYPFALFMALIFTLWGFSTEIVPTFATILPPERWTGNAATMYAVSQFITTWFPLIAMIAGGLVAAAILSLPILTGPVRPYLDKLPPWSVYKISQGASYMIAMRGFISAGASIPDALRNMLKTGNPYFRERVAATLARINMGRNLGEAMLEAGYNFPDDQNLRRGLGLRRARRVRRSPRPARQGMDQRRCRARPCGRQGHQQRHAVPGGRRHRHGSFHDVRTPEPDRQLGSVIKEGEPSGRPVRPRLRANLPRLRARHFSAMTPLPGAAFFWAGRNFSMSVSEASFRNTRNRP